MADVKEDYSTDICLLQTAVNLGMEEAEVGVIVGFTIKEMREYSKETGYDPATSTDDESERALKQVVIRVQERINKEVTTKVSIEEIFDVISEFSSVVDEYKKEEK